MNKNIKYSQNFLTSEKVLNQIIKQLNLKETDTVYEIGTGKGHLTTKLAKISKQVTSIELDSHLFNLSSEKLKLNTRVTLIHQDILQFQFPNKQRYKIVGSIPYHLSTQIIKKVVFESHASDIYLIVEEGFYKRTLDIHRTLGLLLHTQVSIQQLLKLPAECFHPKPKVNSVLIKLMKKIGCHMEAVLSKENQPALPTHNKILTQIKSTCSVSKVLDEGQYKAGESTRHIISRLFFNFSKA